MAIAQSERLMEARCRLMTREPWYGHVAMGMEWKPSNMSWTPESRRTMGVRIVNGGVIQCLYYPPFVESQTIKQLFATIQHEIEHIVRCHCIRIGHRHPQAWNIAADMTVNGRKGQPRIGYHEQSSTIVLPLDGNIVFIPEDWPPDASSEVYYDMLEKNFPKGYCPSCGRPFKGKGKGKQDSSGEGEDGEGEQAEGACRQCGQADDGQYHYGSYHGKAIDDHSTWNQSDVSHDEARQVVRDLVTQATEKCQGYAPGHLAEAIKALGKPVVRWRELLRHYLGKHVGNRRRTYSRAERRFGIFGMKGISHHAAAHVNVIVDTSGSIGPRELEQFFAEIDSISSRAQVHVLQWDAAFQGYNKYRRGDWKRFAVHGRGGTDMAAPVQWLMDQRRIADVQIMLTDGYCNYADKQEFPMITVITTPDGTTDAPDWGHVVRLRVTD